MDATTTPGRGGAGYSGTPLPCKLGIRAGSSVVLLSAPEGFEAVLAPLPENVKVTSRLPKGPSGPLVGTSAKRCVDVAVLFTTSQADLGRRFAHVAGVLQPAGGFWVAWPKRASGVPTDLTETAVREVGLAHGLVDNKVCAITDVWSGLRFVVRLRDRPR
ncbi:MAG: DUF3052 domain-containing protein [Actinomycetota bacterium]|nr:DUF3052 domain-containing protein [Actinomycetota bacterium]